MRIIPLVSQCELSSPSRHMDLFPRGLLLDPLFIISPSKMMGEIKMRRTARPTLNRQNSEISQASSTAEEFRVAVDVSDFEPAELRVTAADGCITIRGQHEEKHDDHGCVSRSFVRRLALPSDVLADDVVCELAPNGTLNVMCPKRKLPEQAPEEKTVPIKRLDNIKLDEGQQKINQ